MIKDFDEEEGTGHQTKVTHVTPQNKVKGRTPPPVGRRSEINNEGEEGFEAELLNYEGKNT